MNEQLPFTRAEFLDVFGAYNTALWPWLVALWVLTLLFAIPIVRGHRPDDRAVSALLVIHWIWSAVAYHAGFFATINPAAWLFAGLFPMEAVVIARLGVFRRRLQFTGGHSVRHLLASFFVVFALAYPFVVQAEGLRFPRAPAFGVPCPTTIFTIGVLLTAKPLPGSVTIIPIFWAAIAGSSAFLLGVRSDLILFAAATALIGFLLGAYAATPHAHSTCPTSRPSSSRP